MTRIEQDTFEPPILEVEPSTRRLPLFPAAFVIAAVFAGAIYANLSFAVTNRANFRYFPPFRPFVDANDNRHLGGEYREIGRALARGDGFSNAFPGCPGSTAWMPPILSAFQGFLFWVFADDRDMVMIAIVFCQVYALILTGLLAIGLAWQSGRFLGPWFAALVFVGTLCCNFRQAFQFTHDSWLVLLALDLVVAGFCWTEPLKEWKRALAWGFVGGLCALINPMVALVWGVLSLALAWQLRKWKPFLVTALVGALVLLPWTVRNYLVFGKLIPVKSNLSYELYQSQCLQPDGLIQKTTFDRHPYSKDGPERQQYRQLGEIAFVEAKSRQFWDAVAADPLDFLDRVACRMLGVLVWYIPFDRDEPVKRPYAYWLAVLTHPVPFLSLVFLGVSALWRPLSRSQWVVLAAFLLYLAPYIAASYYERYGLPLLGLKVILVVWGGDRLIALALELLAPSTRSNERIACESRSSAVPASR